MHIDSYKIATFDRLRSEFHMDHGFRCDNCKHSRKITGIRCIKNGHGSCLGQTAYSFEYNHWEAVNPVLPDNLFDI